MFFRSFPYFERCTSNQNVPFGIRSGMEGVVALTPEEARTSLESVATDRGTDREDAIQRVRKLHSDPAWATSCDTALKDTLARLRAHRSKLRTELLTEDTPDQGWLAGFDDVEEVGFDLYCLTILLPEAR